MCPKKGTNKQTKTKGRTYKYGKNGYTKVAERL